MWLSVLEYAETSKKITLALRLGPKQQQRPGQCFSPLNLKKPFVKRLTKKSWGVFVKLFEYAFLFKLCFTFGPLGVVPTARFVSRVDGTISGRWVGIYFKIIS